MTSPHEQFLQDELTFKNVELILSITANLIFIVYFWLKWSKKKIDEIEPCKNHDRVFYYRSYGINKKKNKLKKSATVSK